MMMHSFVVLSVVLCFLFISPSWSLPVEVKYLYHDNSCTSSYQIELVYAGVCIYSQDNNNSTTVQVSIIFYYYNLFTSWEVVLTK